MAIFGISAGFHDAALTVLDDRGNILFAGHSERYSKKKHDSQLSDGLIAEALKYGTPDVVVYYEDPLLKKTRQLYSGEYSRAFNLKDITCKSFVKNYAPALYTQTNSNTVFMSTNHHLSHAAAGFQTSPFDRATVVVIDAIGEWDTISIWGAEYLPDGTAKYTQLWRQRYPHSIGLFYSAITDRVGLRPMDEEYILMGMAGWGTGFSAAGEMNRRFIADRHNAELKENLHAGVEKEFLDYMDRDADIAAGAQMVCETLIYAIMEKAGAFEFSRNLVYMGGVALNCLANRDLDRDFDNVWIMPNPGDAGSSLGAAAQYYGKKINWQHPYLGTDIPGPYPVKDVIQELLTNKIVGVATGRAEFGPRALGNRSLLADPRGSEIKDKVNEIKRRQKFRPFAPVILEEFANEYFMMPNHFQKSPYMQAVAQCRFPNKFPAIIHVDGSSRVQTVGKDCGSGIRQLLEAWYAETGCPLLLNTSLNIRGEPMIDTREDADRFEKEYGVKVCS